MELNKKINNYLFVNKSHLDVVKLAFENLNLVEALEKAAKSIDPTNQNKMFSHQRRVGYITANEGYEKLKIKIEEFRACITFEDMMKITDEVKNNTKGLGNLWSYDTALRIGFRLGILPTHVYIQNGVIKGYKKLFNVNPKKRHVEKTVFPQELQVLEPYEIENFLCVLGSNQIKKRVC